MSKLFFLPLGCASAGIATATSASGWISACGAKRMLNGVAKRDANDLNQTFMIVVVGSSHSL